MRLSKGLPLICCIIFPIGSCLWYRAQQTRETLVVLRPIRILGQLLVLSHVVTDEPLFRIRVPSTGSYLKLASINSIGGRRVGFFIIWLEISVYHYVIGRWKNTRSATQTTLDTLVSIIFFFNTYTLSIDYLFCSL